MPKHRHRGDRVYMVLFTNEKNKAVQHLRDFCMDFGFCQDMTSHNLKVLLKN